jgi:hypothetical protein
MKLKSLLFASLLCAALDSHVYWQLSDPDHRSSGCVRDPGTQDPDDAEEIRAATALLDRLHAQLHGGHSR